MTVFDRRRLPAPVFKLDVVRMRHGWYSDKYFINIARTLAELAAAGVELVGDEAVASAAAGIAVGRASESDWASEFLDLKLAVGVVDSLEDAIDHVNRYGSGHSEAIVTGSDRAALEFTEGADAAAVYVNASTRFTDGFEYGLGAEVGNSTQKLHARGPIGLRELMTTKYVLRGEGQVRE